jgi:hypothetical protein
MPLLETFCDRKKLNGERCKIRPKLIENVKKIVISKKINYENLVQILNFEFLWLRSFWNFIFAATIFAAAD